MGKVSLEHPKIGDSISKATLNSDLQEFASESGSLQSVNLRPQGLDINSFQRGVLTPPDYYSPHVRDIFSEKNITYEVPKAQTWHKNEILSNVHFNTNQMGKIDFDNYYYIFRYSYHLFLNWHKAGTTGTLGNNGFISLQTRVFATGTFNSSSFNDYIQNYGRHTLQVEEQLVQSSTWQNQITFATLIDPNDFPGVAAAGAKVLDSLSFAIQTYLEVYQDSQNPMKINLKCSKDKGNAYIQVFKK